MHSSRFAYRPLQWPFLRVWRGCPGLCVCVYVSRGVSSGCCVQGCVCPGGVFIGSECPRGAACPGDVQRQTPTCTLRDTLPHPEAEKPHPRTKRQVIVIICFLKKRCTMANQVLLTTSSVRTSIRLQRTDFFASKALTAMFG